MLNWLKKSPKSKPNRPPLTTCYTAGYGVHPTLDTQDLIQEGYQKNVIVYRSVNLIARNAASVSWMLYHGDHELENHPMLNLMNEPNPMQTRAMLMEGLMAHILLSGNGYVEAILSPDHQVLELHLLRPDRLHIVPGKGGIPSAYEYRVNGTRRLIPVDQETGKSRILHLKLFHPSNDWYGMSPLEAAAFAIHQHNGVGEHNLSLLQNGGRPSGALVIKSPENSSSPLTADQREHLRESLTASYEGNQNAGRILVLEGNMDWREMALNPKDMDFVAGKNLSSREIAQAYGVPPMLVGVSGDATFANYQEARLHLWEDTILPLLDMVMEEFTRWLGPLHCENAAFTYDMDAIPALSKRREYIWERLKNVDFLTINEKRAALGYSPVDPMKVHPPSSRTIPA